MGGLAQWNLEEDGDFRTLNRYYREERKKMVRLLLHYKIKKWQPNCWYDLALALARHHVPGFRRHAKPGAKLRWDAETLDRLKAQIHELQARRHISIAGACQILANREPWVNLGRRNTAEALRSAYYQSRSTA
jgi:hypothetical protein